MSGLTKSAGAKKVSRACLGCGLHYMAMQRAGYHREYCVRTEQAVIQIRETREHREVGNHGIDQGIRRRVGRTFADQWLDIITVGQFGEHVALMPGVYQEANQGRGSNTSIPPPSSPTARASMFPENTAAFIFDQSGIESIITESGGYEYRTGGTESVFAGDGIGKSIFGQIGERFKYGGEPVANKRVAFVNLREIRGLQFGTPAPAHVPTTSSTTPIRHSRARGMMSLRITNSDRVHPAISCRRTWITSVSMTPKRSRSLGEFMRSRSQSRSTR